MQISHRIAQVSALALGVAGALAIGQAQASGFQLRESSVANLGRANAGSAVFNNDASVVSANPAALSSFTEKAVRADVTVIDLTAEFKGGGVAAAPLAQANPAAAPLLALQGGNGGDPGDATVVPNLAFVLPLDGAFDKLTLGASVGGPFGLKTEYENDWVGRYHALTSDVKIMDLTLSASVELSERFSVGASLIWERAEVTLSKAIDFGTAVCLGSGNPANCLNPAYPFRPQANDGAISVDGTSNSMGWLAGVQFRPTDKLTIGYSHRSEVDHELEGTVDFTVPGAVQVAMGPAAAAYADGPGGAKLTTPSIDTISARYDFSDKFRLLADYQRTGWESLREVDVRRSNGVSLGAEGFEWKDTNFYSLGAEYDISERFTLRGGVAHDETPTNDTHRTPRLPDQDRSLYSLGLTWNVSPALRVDAAYQRIEIKDPKVNVVSSSASLLDGKFEGYANLFGVAAQYRF